jgi:hypothetical protein
MMAEAGGVGTLRALYQNGILDKIGTISSNSGGSWFNTQFTFSKDYYENVVGIASGEASMTTWYAKYLAVAMEGLLTGSLTGDGTWEAGITGMNSWDAADMTDQPATPANRNGNKAGDVIIATTFMGDSLLSDNTTISQMKVNGVDAFFSVPGYYAIPADTTESPAYGIPTASATDPTDLSALTWEANGVSATAAEVIATLPTASKIGGMSSAASAITGNPELMTATIAANTGGMAEFEAVMGSGQTPANSVCTTASETCEFPAAMTMDGCYSDNLALALNVGYQQRKYPGKKLRFMAVTSNMCNRTSDPTCYNSVQGSSFRSFFADSPYPNIEGGWFYSTDPNEMYQVPGPNRQIFSESITDMQALGQQTGVGGMTLVTGTFTTVDNTAFGVAAGTEVSLVVLMVNGPMYIVAGGVGDSEGLAQVAENAYQSWNTMFSAYESTGSLSSSSAFLYYQTEGGPATLR